MITEKDIAKEIITLLETLKVKEDGFHLWRDHNNECIDRCKKAITEKYGIDGDNNEKSN